jgi:membrane-bound serine protease (ClpP class)
LYQFDYQSAVSDWHIGGVYSGGRLLRLLAISAIALALSAAPAGVASKAEVVDVDGVVHPITADIVGSAIARAERENASVIIVRLNTPGGLMDAMRETIEKIASSPIPVITYVAPSGGRAASAGFFILEAGDIAAMAPATNTGAAHPVAMGGQMDAIMKQKVENDAAAYLRSIVAKRGRNATLAESAVRESKSFTEREALDQHLIELVAPNERELLAAVDGRTVTRLNGSVQTLHTAGAQIEVYQRSLRQRVISAIADPNIALILLFVGAMLIFVEFSHPGLFAPGVFGAIFALLGLSAISILPINWLGAALLLAGFAMFVLEAFYPTHGVLGVGGAVALLLGALTLINSPMPEMRIHWEIATALVLPFSAIMVLLLTLAMRAHRRKVDTGPEGMIGETGAAITPLEPEGKIFVHGEYWDAVASQPVPAGARVRVIAMERLKLTVEPVHGDLDRAPESGIGQRYGGT